MTQQIIVALIVVAAVVAAIRSVWRTVHNRPNNLNACQSCKLKDHCTTYTTAGCNCHNNSCPTKKNVQLFVVELL